MLNPTLEMANPIITTPLLLMETTNSIITTPLSLMETANPIITPLCHLLKMANPTLEMPFLIFEIGIFILRAVG